MKNFHRIILIIGIAFLLLPSNYARAQDEPSAKAAFAENSNIEDALNHSLKSKLKRGAYFLLGIESKLKKYTGDLSLMRTTISTLKNKIDESKVHIENLQSQLANLDRLTDLTTEKISALKLQIASLDNEIAVGQSDIFAQEKEQKQALEVLNKTLLVYYVQNNTLGVAPLLADVAGMGNALRHNGYLSVFHEINQRLGDEILAREIALEDARQKLTSKKERKETLRDLLNAEMRTLNASRESKKRLLEETQGKQIIYETLLELSKKEEAQVALTIARLKENYAFFQDKLAQLPKSSEQSTIQFQFEQEGNIFRWPVNPSLGISAFFHDEDYQKTLGLAHNAIDIRIPQGSKIIAATDGVVTKIVDNGFTYSYVIIAHPGNLLTLYGHMSEIFVNEGELVTQGKVIGLSGGIPGTKGAGWLTTGAHLHFEVLKNWQHVDPLEYLSLEYLPLESLPEKYLKKIVGNEKREVPRLNLGE